MEEQSSRAAQRLLSNRTMSTLAFLAIVIPLGGCLLSVDESSADPTPTSPTVSVGQDKAADGLDHDVIRRYVRKSLPKITACYEAALAKEPKLAGNVTSTFEIAPDGHVLNATTSGLPAVAPCVASVIRAIEFPKPTNNASVNVTYPFAFAPG
jgi:outer membrane biosynthesis protein TonB